MSRRLLAALVTAVAWPLARALRAWDAADQRLANTYASNPSEPEDGR